MLILLSTLLRQHVSPALPEPLARAARPALERGARFVHAHGLLRKGVGLCHGVAGSVYALLAVSDALDPGPDTANAGLKEQTWLRAAAHLAHCACAYERLTARGEMRTPDRPYSLYECIAGMCCAWADVVARIDGRKGSGMPGYDDLV